MMRTRRVAKWALLSIAAFGLLLVIFAALVVGQRINSKIRAPHDAARASYRDFLIDVAPEAQFESHTCGLHTLRVIYKSYGLDPDRENLRYRLGLDTPANPFDSESTGTLQPDMLRVLHQDGFAYEFLDLTDLEGSVDRLVDHLVNGNMAAVLIARRENAAMHWVAAQKIIDSELVILDSLRDEPHHESPSSFIRDVAISCLLVEPSASATDSGDSSLTAGTFEFYDTLKRYSVIKEQRAEQDAGAKRDERHRAR